jgi:microcystin-dependent protein
MPTGVMSWSQTAASNASADSNVNWSEGQAPSSVNDSARAMMASAAKWRDDVTGINVTGGSGTAYTLTSNQIIASNLNGMTIQFTPGTTNTGAVTLSVDGQTAKPIRFATGVDLPAGALISGSLYQVTYRSAVEEWLLHSFDASVYAIPVGGSIDYWGTTAPNGAFVLPYGQAISRTVYSGLFAMLSTTFGVGDGSTTFNIPDLRGRVVAGKDNMGGSSANRLTDADDGLNGDVLGDTGGGETQALVTANTPSYTPSGTVSILAIVQNVRDYPSVSGFSDANTLSQGNTSGTLRASGVPYVSGTATFTGVNNGGTSTAFGIVQPTIIANKLLRII